MQKNNNKEYAAAAGNVPQTMIESPEVSAALGQSGAQKRSSFGTSTKNNSTPSDQSACSSHRSSTKHTKVVVVNLAQSSKGKKSKRKAGGSGAGQKRRTGTGVEILNQEAQGSATTHTSSSNPSSLDPPQRSRSEAPTGNSIGNVLYEVHKKLMNRGRKLSPAKLQARQQERQERAEHLRAKIELSRKEWCMKVSQRQQLARARQQETVERKQNDLHNLENKLQRAARNKEAEILKKVEKAQDENLRAEETKYIIKLTQQNNKLDLNQKFRKNEERRKQQQEKDQQRIKGQQLKRQTADKRREELDEEMRSKILSKEQKREQAVKRRKEQQVAEKNKAMAEKMKRDLVRERKLVKRHKIGDIMSFVSNRESLWEFIGMEQDLDSMGLQFNLGDVETLNALDEEVDGVRNLNENDLLRTIREDQFELEKLMLKRDHEVLSTCIIEEADGTLTITASPMALLQRGQRGGPKSSSSSNSIDSSEEKKGLPAAQINQLPRVSGPLQLQNSATALEDPKYFSPMKKQTSLQVPQRSDLEKDRRSSDTKNNLRLKHSASFQSNLSSSNQASVKSKDDITTNDEELEEQKAVSQSDQFSKSAHTAQAVDKLDQQIQRQRVRVAMRRNILKRNLSEDLVWAAELQSNPNFEMVRFIGQTTVQQQQYHHSKELETRSHASSLERNDFDDLEDEMLGQSLRENTQETPPKKGLTKTSAAHLSKRNKNKKGNHQSSRTSLHSSGPINLQGISGGSKELNPMMNSGRGQKSTSIQDLQNTFSAKQKKTLSNNGSCTSLSSLIKVKQRQEENDEASELNLGQTSGSLNQAQLEQLGPVVKMTINGFPFTQNIPQYVPMPPSPNQQTNISFSNADAFDDTSQAASLYSTQTTATGLSIHMNSLILSQRPVPSKTNLSSALTSNNLSKIANQILFPIREQKIILMNKERGPEYHFVQARIMIKLEEQEKLLSTEVSTTQSTSSFHQQSVNPATPKQLHTKRASLDTGDIGISTSPIAQKAPVTPQKSSHGKQSSIEETKKTPTKSQYRTDTPGSGKKDRNSNNKNTSIGQDSNDRVGILGEVDEDSDDSVSGQSDRMVNLIVKKLLVDQMQHIRIDDSQKSILFDGDKDSQTVLKYLEVNELKFKYCRLCEHAIHSEYSASSDAEAAKAECVVTEHFQSKAHVRKRDSFQIKEAEDLAYSLLVFISQPGEIDVELRKENEKALKRKVKRLKQSMTTLAVQHENASTYPGKELKSPNKNRLQIRCIELQKSVFPEIRYESVEAILNDVLKVLEKRGPGDLHLMRKLKFIPTMIDGVCKRIATCPRGKLSNLAKNINLVIKILSKFCTLRENRNYMIQTNRVMPLIDLISWCLNRQTELFFGIEFMPGLFQTVTLHLRHRVPYECQLLKEHMVELLICSQIPAKLKNKLAIVKSIQSNEDENQMGQLPFFLLKSVAFLEALTAMISIDARTRPVYEKSFKIGEHIFFILQSTELLGITQMITTLLLTSNETFKASAPSSQSQLILPQTILSLAIHSIKVLNNMMRMDVGIVQHMMQNLKDLSETLYHLLSFILSYTENNIDESDDVKELLHETLIFIGYFCLLNETNQQILHKGENSILQKLCNMPFTYFMDKKLKEILFPTLVAVSYQNTRSVAIMDQELNLDVLVKYIEANIAEELPKIMEQEQEYFSDHTKSMSSFGRARSPSQLSTGSNSAQSVQMDFLSGNNPYLPLVMRFPKNLWKDAAQFFKSNADN